MTNHKKPVEQDGDESDSREREGVTGKARRPDPNAPKNPSAGTVKGDDPKDPARGES